MKKLLIVSLGLLLCLGFALPAAADVDVFATITKDKDITVTENVIIDKDIDITVVVVSAPVGAAEADAILNQETSAITIGNEEVADDENHRTSTITGSMIANTGIVGVNQDSGTGNNQGNVTAVALTDVEAFANSQASADQVTDRNSVFAEDSSKEDLLRDSISGNFGIVGANQSTGNMNNQGNEVAVAASLLENGVLVALAEADLGQVSTNNLVDEVSTDKLDRILNSINGNHGIVGFNQTSGNMNNQANVVSISFIH